MFLHKIRNNRKLSYFLLSLFLLLVVETVLIYRSWINDRREKELAVIDFNKYLIFRAFISPLFLNVQPIPYLSNLKQTFIGNLSPNSGYNWKEFMPPDSLLGFRHGRYISALHMEKYIYVTNLQGFLSIGDNDFYVTKDKKFNTNKVFVVGGSTVMGQGAYTPDENLPAQISKLLNSDAKNGLKYEIINAGVGGYTSGQEFMYIISEIVKYNPDIIIVYDGWNDQSYNNIMINLYGSDASLLKSNTHYDLDSRLVSSYSFTGSLCMFIGNLGNKIMYYLGNSYLLDVVKNLLIRSFQIKRRDNKQLKYQYSPESVSMYKHNLERILDVSNHYETKIAVFLQPIMGVDGKKLTDEEKKYYGEINDLEQRKRFYDDARETFRKLKLQYAKNNKACVGDLSKIFANESARVYADSGHLFINGNSIVAEEIVRSLKKNHILPARVLIK